MIIFHFIVLHKNNANNSYRECQQKSHLGKLGYHFFYWTVFGVLWICFRWWLPDALVQFLVETDNYGRRTTPSRNETAVLKRTNLHVVEGDVANKWPHQQHIDKVHWPTQHLDYTLRLCLRTICALVSPKPCGSACSAVASVRFFQAP